MRPVLRPAGEPAARADGAAGTKINLGQTSTIMIKAGAISTSGPQL
jgi:hypothetical protein